MTTILGVSFFNLQLFGVVFQENHEIFELVILEIDCRLTIVPINRLEQRTLIKSVYARNCLIKTDVSDDWPVPMLEINYK